MAGTTQNLGSWFLRLAAASIALLVVLAMPAQALDYESQAFIDTIRKRDADIADKLQKELDALETKVLNGLVKDITKRTDLTTEQLNALVSARLPKERKNAFDAYLDKVLDAVRKEAETATAARKKRLNAIVDLLVNWIGRPCSFLVAEVEKRKDEIAAAANVPGSLLAELRKLDPGLSRELVVGIGWYETTAEFIERLKTLRKKKEEHIARLEKDGIKTNPENAAEGIARAKKFIVKLDELIDYYTGGKKPTPKRTVERPRSGEGTSNIADDKIGWMPEVDAAAEYVALTEEQLGAVFVSRSDCPEPELIADEPPVTAPRAARFATQTADEDVCVGSVYTLNEEFFLMVEEYYGAVSLPGAAPAVAVLGPTSVEAPPEEEFPEADPVTGAEENLPSAGGTTPPPGQANAPPEEEFPEADPVTGAEENLPPAGGAAPPPGQANAPPEEEFPEADPVTGAEENLPPAGGTTPPPGQANAPPPGGQPQPRPMDQVQAPGDDPAVPDGSDLGLVKGGFRVELVGDPGAAPVTEALVVFMQEEPDLPLLMEAEAPRDPSIPYGPEPQGGMTGDDGRVRGAAGADEYIFALPTEQAGAAGEQTVDLPVATVTVPAEPSAQIVVSYPLGADGAPAATKDEKFLATWELYLRGFLEIEETDADRISDAFANRERADQLFDDPRNAEDALSDAIAAYWDAIGAEPGDGIDNRLLISLGVRSGVSAPPTPTERFMAEWSLWLLGYSEIPDHSREDIEKHMESGGRFRDLFDDSTVASEELAGGLGAFRADRGLPPGEGIDATDLVAMGIREVAFSLPGGLSVVGTGMDAAAANVYQPPGSKLADAIRTRLTELRWLYNPDFGATEPEYSDVDYDYKDFAAALAAFRRYAGLPAGTIDAELLEALDIPSTDIPPSPVEKVLGGIRAEYSVPLPTRESFQIAGSEFQVITGVPAKDVAQIADEIRSALIEQYENSSQVVVEKDICLEMEAGDVYFTSAGAWGQDFDDQWAIKRAGYTDGPDSAWAIAGAALSPVTVAVIDSGLDWRHPDIDPAHLWRNEGERPNNGIDDDGNGYVDDVIGWDFIEDDPKPYDHGGHGTFVAGIIAAKSGNGLGIAGINPAARIMTLRTLDPFGRGYASMTARAIAYAADNGAKVINLSLGGVGSSNVVEHAIAHAREKGAVVVVAAGNDGRETKDFAPARYDGAITVTATDRRDKRAPFSNFGPAVDIAAPGVEVLSLRGRGTDLLAFIRAMEYEPGTGVVGNDRAYYRASGTSFAAPVVSGTIALVLSAKPELSADEAARMVLHSARDIEIEGVDNLSGYGIVDAAAALRADPAFFVEARIDGVGVVKTDRGQALRVLGTANASAFAGARIEIGVGEEPAEWRAVDGAIETAVSAGTLIEIPAKAFASAPAWTIRLIAKHANGQTREARFLVRLG